MCSLRIWSPFFISTQSGPKRVDFFRGRPKFEISKFSTRLSPHASVGTNMKRIPIISSYSSKSQLSLEKKIKIFYQKLKKIQYFEIWLKIPFFSPKIDFGKKSRKYPKNVTNVTFFYDFNQFLQKCLFFSRKDMKISKLSLESLWSALNDQKDAYYIQHTARLVSTLNA